MSQYDEFEEQGSQKLKFQIRQILKLKKNCQNQNNNIDNVTM